ncbi:MAG: hypothetical protein HYY76_17520 [Acidobacteria bacterium]|nr:hypothetical protein [Acidobacteriota bacterium]
MSSEMGMNGRGLVMVAVVVADMGVDEGRTKGAHLQRRAQNRRQEPTHPMHCSGLVDGSQDA